MIYEGRQVKIFDCGDGTAVKQFKGPHGESLMKLETFVMEYLRLFDYPVPEVLERSVPSGGLPSYKMRHLEGGHLLSVVEEGRGSLSQAARLMGELHARLHQLKAPPRIGRLKERLAGEFRATNRLSEPVKRSVLKLLAELPDGEQVCHGDFHPGNVMQSADGCFVIDWVGVEAGHPLADVARTRMMLRFGSRMRLSSVRDESDSLPRTQFADLYLKQYRSMRDADADVLAKWERVRAAELFVKQEPCDMEALAAQLHVS